MSRTVFCRKYQQEMEGLDAPPFPGPKGLDIFDNISKKAWQEWMAHQTMLINEKRLNMMEPSSRAYLSEQMQKFLSGEAYDEAEGYVPPEEDKND
ncbi:oxidative damage protection protein [Microbulbifer marinus]|uniref:Probable Fe(2+)-trafficking protein n=1 Tax=Microbulbifer marinus TaxID=658218 RepID=A0A1H3YQV5_9GAMM|nr:oxidative damage protection protein [Microbulbifer marinus]SEA13757.1 Fe-S cluster biosynthesis and repair protein YggX [Microbulbifer marinus]